MAKFHKIKITVLRRFAPSEVLDPSPVTLVDDLDECELFRNGQEFVVENMKMPEGFCSSAWYSIYCNIKTLSYGGDIPWYKEKNVAINCCIDGLRPVIFKLERL